MLTFVFEFELCSLEVLKKIGSRMSLRLKKPVLVRSNYIPHTFNPCGDVTMSYLLCSNSIVSLIQTFQLSEHHWSQCVRISDFILYCLITRPILLSSHKVRTALG